MVIESSAVVSAVPVLAPHTLTMLTDTPLQSTIASTFLYVTFVDVHVPDVGDNFIHCDKAMAFEETTNVKITNA